MLMGLKAKLIGGAVLGAALLAFGVHYKMLVSDRDKLEAEKVGFQLALSKAAANMATLAEDARIAQAATADAIAAREANRVSLEAFRAGRKQDPESAEWGAQPLPIGELVRLCEALPEMDGCVNTQ